MRNMLLILMLILYGVQGIASKNLEKRLGEPEIRKESKNI